MLVSVALAACTSEGSREGADQDVAIADEGDTSNEPAYPSHTEAALAAAEKRDPGLVNPDITAAIVIFSDETTVDLRVQVRADNGYCDWFGVNATLRGSAIQWRAAGANGCSDE